MNFDDIKFKYPRYRFENTKLCVGSKTPFDIDPNVIHYFYVEKDYDGTYFPYFEIGITVPYWVYHNVSMDPDNVFMIIDLKYGMFDTEISPSIPLTTDLRGKFKCLIEDATPDISGEWQLKREQEEGVLNERYGGNDQMPLQMILFNPQYYNSYDHCVNAVFSSATPIAAMTYVFNQIGMSNILISPPDNRKSYREFKVTPIQGIKQIARLCNNYALHKNGSVIFFDLDRGYIISKKPECTAWVPNEWKTTHLICLENYHMVSGFTDGQYKDSKEKANVLNIVKDSIMDGGGSDAGSYTRHPVIEATNGGISMAGEGRAVGDAFVYEEGDNSASIVVHTESEDEKAFMCKLGHCALSCLNPNKLFVVTIDDPKLRHLCGKYRIVRFSCSFENEGSYWVPNIVAEFRGK